MSTDTIDLDFVSVDGAPVKLELTAFHVMGQTDQLRQYLERTDVPAL